MVFQYSIDEEHFCDQISSEDIKDSNLGFNKVETGIFKYFLQKTDVWVVVEQSMYVETVEINNVCFVGFEPLLYFIWSFQSTFI